MKEIIIGIFIILACIGVAAIIDANKPKKAKRYNHNPNHPGITINTIEGKKDIICPKCHSPYCQYDYQTIQHSDSRTTYRIRPLHLFRPVKSTTYEIPHQTTIKQFRCTNCGWVFK